MGLLNFKCIGILVLCVMGTWNFPFGAIFETGFVTAWIRFKIKYFEQEVYLRMHFFLVRSLMQENHGLLEG
nr:hypothetical protein [Candidatus Sigynarchaeota archaeon]